MMVLPSSRNVTEIVRFSDFKLNEPEAETFEMTKGLDGCVRSYHGTRVGSVEEGVWVQEWLSLDHHVAFQRSPTYPSFTARVASFASTQKLDILHVQLRPCLAERAFTTPFTEITVATLRSESQEEALEATVKEADLSDLSHGTIMEDSTHSQYLIVNGWESVEAFETALSNSPLFKALGEIAELDTSLYRLST